MGLIHYENGFDDLIKDIAVCLWLWTDSNVSDSNE